MVIGESNSENDNNVRHAGNSNSENDDNGMLGNNCFLGELQEN